MKFDVEIPVLGGMTRVEIKTVREDKGCAAHIAFISERALSGACLMLGRFGIPHRFSGNDEIRLGSPLKISLNRIIRH